MNVCGRLLGGFIAAVSGTIILASDSPLAQDTHRAVNGTVWVANRGTHTIRGFDAESGVEVRTIDMAPNSQPGDLAYAKGKLYVSEEFGTPPAIAIVDAETGVILQRKTFPTGFRPHHVHASAGGNLVAVGLFGTDLVAVIDTHNDVLLGPWDSDPMTTNGRIHAAVFSQDGNTLYLANEARNELVVIDPHNGAVLWSMPVPGIHELAITNNEKTAYVSQRSANKLAVIDLEARAFVQQLTLGLPDTLRLSANEKLLTVGLRTSPAQMAVVDTDLLVTDPLLALRIVTLSEPGQTTTIAGHQWTSPGGRYTFESFEGGISPGVVVIDHRAGNSIVQRLGYAGRPHGVDFARP